MATMTTTDPAALAAVLRGLLATLDRDETTASALTRARVQGAVTACEVLAGSTTAAVADLLAGPDHTTS